MTVPEVLFLYYLRYYIPQTQSSWFQIGCFIPDSKHPLDTWKVIRNNVYTKYERRSRVSDFALDYEKLVLDQKVQVTAECFVFLICQVGKQGLAGERVPILWGVSMVANTCEVCLGNWQRQCSCRKKVLYSERRASIIRTFNYHAGFGCT
jgi:hypothetical protein